MNTETGQIYRDEEEIRAAMLRGENLVEVSERVAQLVEAGQKVLNRAERRDLQKQRRAANRKLAREKQKR